MTESVQLPANIEPAPNVRRMRLWLIDRRACPFLVHFRRGGLLGLDRHRDPPEAGSPSDGESLPLRHYSRRTRIPGWIRTQSGTLGLYREFRSWGRCGSRAETKDPATGGESWASDSLSTHHMKLTLC